MKRFWKDAFCLEAFRRDLWIWETNIFSLFKIKINSNHFFEKNLWIRNLKRRLNRISFKQTIWFILNQIFTAFLTASQMHTERKYNFFVQLNLLHLTFYRYFQIQMDYSEPLLAFPFEVDLEFSSFEGGIFILRAIRA